MKQTMVFSLLLLGIIACRKTKETENPDTPIPEKPIDTIHVVALFPENLIGYDTTNNFLGYIGFARYSDSINIWTVGNYSSDTIQSSAPRFTIRYVGGADLVDTSTVLSTNETYVFKMNPQLINKPIFEVYDNGKLVKTWVVATTYRTSVTAGSSKITGEAFAKQTGAACNYYLKKLNSLPIRYKKF